ncbi:MAG: hypothetical protein EOP67_37160 [Sphingomonas sp.]|nr:MAG: hypothetical protein EOP67_37160 [Sphingomonas sp.]
MTFQPRIPVESSLRPSAANGISIPLSHAPSALATPTSVPAAGFVSASTAQLNRDARAGLKTQYSAQLGPECRSITAMGFPFRASPREATIDDFSRLFRPSGLIDAFMTSNLAGQIDTSRRQWALTQSGRALGLSPQAVAQLSKAGRIRDTFFKPGDIRPNLRFLIEPIRVGGDAAAMTLTVDGAPAAFDRVNRPGVEMRWPGNAPGVTLSVQHNGSTTPSIPTPGMPRVTPTARAPSTTSASRTSRSVTGSATL